MSEAIQIVEPTLVDARGHCRSLLASFCAAAPEVDVRVWAGRGVDPGILGTENVQVTPWFWRRLRVPQRFFLYRRLLREPGVLFVPTAGRTDVLLMDRALGSSTATDKVVLFMHWLRPDPSRLRSLSAVARRRPDLRILGATASVAGLLAECGFRRAVHVPYPVTSTSAAQPAGRPFSHLLYAGAARRDKGFHRFVDLVAGLGAEGPTWPVIAQTGGDYYDRMDPVVREDVTRLAAIGYPFLRTVPGGLDDPSYLALFAGAVAVQLYAPGDWADRASGITLDALSAGAPILTFRGSWMARQAERFEAGIAVEADAPATWTAAARSLVERYAAYSAGAARAGATLAREYHPRRLVDAVLG